MMTTLQYEREPLEDCKSRMPPRPMKFYFASLSVQSEQEGY